MAKKASNYQSGNYMISHLLSLLHTETQIHTQKISENQTGHQANNVGGALGSKLVEFFWYSKNVPAFP